MRERRGKPRRPTKHVEYQGVLGEDKKYEFKEFHASESNVITIPHGWQFSFLEGKTALYRRKKS